MENAKEIFVKTESINEKNEAEKIRERLQNQRDKRIIVEKLKNVKSLVDSDEEEDAAEWYVRMKQKDSEKDLSRKRARKQEENRDDDVEKVDSKRRRDAMYSSKDLKGLAIGHKVDSIKDGTHVILTLRDKDVLKDDEDILENVNILDDEKASKNVENKGKKPEYKPYDDDEFDEFGILKKTSLLSKYDDEIEGPKKDVFRIGEGSSNSDLVKMKLQQQQEQGKITLSLPEFKVASEYYTAEEMVKFKKPKRKGGKALRKRIVNIELKEETKPVELDTSNHNDHGSRSKKQEKGKKETKSNSQKAHSNGKAKTKVQLDINKVKDELDLELDLIGPDEDLTGIRIEEDEAEKELFSALNKTRKLKLKERKDNIDPALDIAKIVQERNIKMEDDNDDSNGVWDASNLILDTTAEFCRNLGDIPKYESGFTASKVEDDEIDMDMEDDMAADEVEDSDNKYRNNWNEVDIKMEDEPEEDPGLLDNHEAHSPTQYESKPILEEEPDVSVGVAGALKLAMTKGYLDKESNKPMGATRASSSISALAYQIEEKFYDDDRMGRRDRYSGQLSEFKDKESYKPDFKLDYVDDKGRMMSQKEAFRYLSHKFHGKGPGKNKVDKRMKKFEQESKLRQMSSIDTPLNTLKLLQDKQKEVQAPYIVLTGQRSTSTATQMTQISKKK